MILTLNKFTSVGPFHLEDSIKRYDFSFDIERDREYGDSYILTDEGLSLVVDQECSIHFIICRMQLLINDTNVIGMLYPEFLNLLSLKSIYKADILDFEEDSVPQLVYEIDEWGLQVWTKANEIVTVIV